MQGGKSDSDDELRDLHGGQSTLDPLWDSNADGGKCVVGVL